MLQNAYFLAKFGADTAENEQHFADILPKIGEAARGSQRDLQRSQRLLGWLRGRYRLAEAYLGQGKYREAREAVEGRVERFDRRGTEPFELFRSEFG